MLPSDLYCNSPITSSRTLRPNQRCAGLVASAPLLSLTSGRVACVLCRAVSFSVRLLLIWGSPVRAGVAVPVKSRGCEGHSPTVLPSLLVGKLMGSGSSSDSSIRDVQLGIPAARGLSDRVAAKLNH